LSFSELEIWEWNEEEQV